ncbi:MAG: hypothetical protein CMG85_18925 [Marinobacter sp.]|nr:hypothetical protein [Marinobacter sp.]
MNTQVELGQLVVHKIMQLKMLLELEHKLHTFKQGEFFNLAILKKIMLIVIMERLGHLLQTILLL